MTDSDAPSTGKDFTNYARENPVLVEKLHHEGGFKAAFDTTTFSDAESFKRILDRFGFLENEGMTGDKYAYQMGSKKVSPRFVWTADDVNIQTTTNPLTGEKNRFSDEIEEEYYTPEEHKGECGYIHIVGEEEVVREVVAAIEEHAEFVKASSVGKWDY